MAKPQSIHLMVIDSYVKNYFKNNPGITADLLIRAKEQTHTIFREYGFNSLSHQLYNNKHNAAYSTGCGCPICKVRYDYVKVKLRLHRAKKAYYNDIYWGIRSENELKQDQEFNNFVELLNKEISKVKKHKDDIISQFVSLGINIVE